MFIAHKKEHNEIVSKPKPYDIVFISYQEPNADENYKRILKRFPQCKRIHGVKGIHQAHIEAAKLCNTPMFWIIDGDADIVEDFNPSTLNFKTLDTLKNTKIEKLKINNTKELEYFRVRFISKKSIINDLFKKFKTSLCLRKPNSL